MWMWMWMCRCMYARMLVCLYVRTYGRTYVFHTHITHNCTRKLQMFCKRLKL